MKVVYKKNGKRVSRQQFCAGKPKPPAGPENISRSLEPQYHMASEGAAVDPRDRQAATEYARRCGVPTEHDKHGRPIFISLRHQRRYLKTIGMHNNDSYM